MASTIILSDNGTSSGSAGLKQTAGNDGVLILQTTTSGGTATNAVYVDTLQNIGVSKTPNTWLSTFKAIQGGSAASGPNGQPTSGSLSFRTDYSQTYLHAGGYRDASGNQVWAATNSSNNYVQIYGMDSYNGFHTWQVSTSANGTAGATATMQTVLGANATGSVYLLGGSSSANGTGITFPASQSASTDANTLDDYEEGTWTPSDGSGAVLTFTNTSGIYVKIGKFVIAQGGFTVPINGNTAAARMNGLPFACTASGGGFSMYASGAVGLAIRNQSSSTNTFITSISSQVTTITNANLSGMDIQVTFIYQV